MEREKPLIVIAGPTAVGKTAISIKLAREINGEIISADSMQVYKGLDIGTDKVSRKIREEIPHHLIDVREATEPFSVVDFVREAQEAVVKIRGKNRYPIVVGGTGFYIRALLYGIPEIPPGSKEIRESLDRLTNVEIYNRMLEIDRESAEKIGKTDKKRLIRAYEVYKLTGKPISSFKFPEQPRYRFSGYFLYRNRAELHRRIEKRVDSQIERGLIGEARWLLQFGKDTTAFQALGYKELVQYVEGKKSLEEAVRLLKRRTKQFAKRQFTWFKKEPKFKWINLSEISEEDVIETIKRNLREEK